tara:strand:+ start:260 stop:436 length:177 start_codon:yes stop_codon:yes gene_type:complete
MSKITNVRLPSPSQEYNVQQQNELVRAIETIVLTLNTSYTAEENKTVMERFIFLLGGD